jgi:hypothetical protein
MTYDHLTLWQRPDSYAGPAWTGYYVVFGRNRDSDSITRSNWHVFTKDLEDKAAELGDAMLDPDGDSFLQVVRDSHWAVGWIEFIYLHQDAPPAILALADERLEDLTDYPVLDEDHWTEMEHAEAEDAWARLCVRDRVAVIIESKCGASIFAARRGTTPPDDNGALHDYLRGS